MEQKNIGLVIRKAEMKDLDSVVAIFKNAIQVMNENGIPQWDEVYPNKEILMDDIIKGEMFLGEIKNEIASVCVINREYDEEYQNGKWNYSEATYSILHRLCVNPFLQNNGIGTKTLSQMEALLKEEGTESIRLDAFSLNPYALRMYEKLGYLKVGEAHFRKGLFYLYEKKIK